MASSNKLRSLVKERLHRRVRAKISGTSERPRLSVSFSGQHIRVQVIDDEASRTLAAVSTTEKSLNKVRPNVEGATKVGKLIAERALTKGVKCVVFDRGGAKYHGKVKALADAAREGGLQF